MQYQPGTEAVDKGPDDNLKKSASEKFIDYIVIYPLVLLSIWGAFYVFWDQSALPGGPVYTIIILSVGGYLTGELVGLTGFPPQLGMLIFGLVIGNLPYTFLSEDLYQLVILQLRWLAIIFSVTKGALGIFPQNIWKEKRTIPLLAVLPYFSEFLTWFLGSHYIAGHSLRASFFIGGLFSTLSGILLGPYLTNLEIKLNKLDPGNLSEHALKTIFIGKQAMGLDAVLGIIFAKSAIGFLFTDEMSKGFLKGPGEVLIGALVGILWGGVSGLLLTKSRHRILRILIIFTGGIVSFIGMRKAGMPRGTHVGVLVGAFAAITIWRGKGNSKIVGLDAIIEFNHKAWKLVEPFLFAVLGARIDIFLVDWKTFGLGLIVFLLCTLVRMAAVFLSTQFSGLTKYERLFLVISWTGKGTLQAAIGPVPMEVALMEQKPPETVEAMRRIMELSVLILLFSNLWGYISVKLLGPKLLMKNESQYVNNTAAV